jgi:hypothetical protein
MNSQPHDVAVNVPGITGHKFLNNRQTLFIGYMLCVLIDLVVLNLYVEFWAKIVIDSFLISLGAAILLQLLLKLSLKAEHRIASYFNAKPGKGAKILRWFFAWVILFGSKFLMLEVIDQVFGEHVELGGILPFYAVAFSIIGAELIITRIYYALAVKERSED